MVDLEVWVVMGRPPRWKDKPLGEGFVV